MSFIEIMHTYFRGEKLEALMFILPVGLLLFGFWFWDRSSEGRARRVRLGDSRTLSNIRDHFYSNRDWCRGTHQRTSYPAALEQIAVTQPKLPDRE